MIIVGFDHTDITRRRLEQSRIRVVELMDIDSSPIDLAVGMSHRAAGVATGRHLIGRGYRRFGYGGFGYRRFGYGFGPALGFGLGYGVASAGYGYPYGGYGYPYGGYGEGGYGGGYGAGDGGYDGGNGYGGGTYGGGYRVAYNGHRGQFNCGPYEKHTHLERRACRY